MHAERYQSKTKQKIIPLSDDKRDSWTLAHGEEGAQPLRAGPFVLFGFA